MLEATALPRGAPISCVSFCSLHIFPRKDSIHNNVEIQVMENKPLVSSEHGPAEIQEKDLGLETVAGQGESTQTATTREIWGHVEANKNSKQGL